MSIPVQDKPGQPDKGPASSQPPLRQKTSPFQGVTRYHWLVVIIAAAGWLFDCMDQRLFTLAREPALKELLGGDPARLAHIKDYIGYATTWMMLGWATGGIFFGLMSDRIGRVKTMVATLLIYSAFTGLSGFAHSWFDFILYRFLVGLGVGGMFGAATALVAESVPSHFRAVALGLLQALSALGNLMGSQLSLLIKPGAANFIGNFSGWQALFFAGIVPSLLVIPIVFTLREPDAWRAAKAKTSQGPQKKLGSSLELFRDPRWRRNTLIGLFLGASGMIGLWAIGFFSPELISSALKELPQSRIDTARALGTTFQDAGSFLGMIAFTLVAAYLSRRIAFFGSFIIAMIATIFVFKSLHTAHDAYWMLPIMGFAQMTLYAGYSIYFPELFPTRLRGTGVGLCYNAVRYLTAPAPALMGLMSTRLGIRNAAVIMSSTYLIGMITLIWAPETRDKPLPEE